MVLPADAKTAFDDLNIVAREGGIDVAAHDRRLPGDVAAACRALEQNLVVVPVGMDQGAFGAKASAIDMTAGSGSSSTTIAAAAACACAKRVRGDRGDRFAVVAYAVRWQIADGRQCRCRGGIGASAPVTIARTPGIRRAAEVSMRTMRADGTWARASAACSMPGRARSTV